MNWETVLRSRPVILFLVYGRWPVTILLIVAATISPGPRTRGGGPPPDAPTPA